MALKPPEVPTYGVRHVMEEEMREAGDGVFEASSNERRRRKASPEAKMETKAPENKAVSAATVPVSARRARGKKRG